MDYQPIDCEFHDRLEDAAVRRLSVQVCYRVGTDEICVRALVLDVRTEGDAEFLVLEGYDPIRLDHIFSFDNHVLNPLQCQTP
jgi:transcriptional antiterminator Rof (Rho-off)